MYDDCRLVGGVFCGDEVVLHDVTERLGVATPRRRQSLRRRLASSIVAGGVFCVFFLNPSRASSTRPRAPLFGEQDAVDHTIAIDPYLPQIPVEVAGGC